MNILMVLTSHDQLGNTGRKVTRFITTDQAEVKWLISCRFW